MSHPLNSHTFRWDAPEIVRPAPPAIADGARHVGLVLPCYNEEGNVDELYERITAVFRELPEYSYELLFIDNASTDGTVGRLRVLAARDARVKVIVNARNFGHIRSPYHALLQSSGDAVVMLCTDLQDPPELIPDFLRHWEMGCPVVVGVKTSSEESPLFYALRSVYYRLARKLADVDLLEHVTGFGLYDRRVIELMRGTNERCPYIRGLISEIGLPITQVPYKQPARRRGVTKNNFLSLIDMALLGVTSHSRLPLRIATLGGFFLSAISLLVAAFYLAFKLLFWDWFPAGMAPVLIGVFFFSSVQLFVIGLVGEYIGAVLIQVRRRPLVVESERINLSAAPEGTCGVEETDARRRERQPVPPETVP